MKLKSQVFSSPLILLTSVAASAAECPPGSSLHVVDGVEKCVLDSSIIVTVDPDWLVAGGVVLVLLVVAIVYLAVQVSRLAKGLKSGGRIV